MTAHGREVCSAARTYVDPQAYRCVSPIAVSVLEQGSYLGSGGAKSRCAMFDQFAADLDIVFRWCTRTQFAEPLPRDRPGNSPKAED